MAIHMVCTCGQEMVTEDQYAGRKVRCPNCKLIVLVPGTRGAPASGRAGRPERDEDEGESGEGLTNRERLGRARIGLGLHWGKTLCFLIVAALGLLVGIVTFIVVLRARRGEALAGGPLEVIVGVLGCGILLAFVVMPVLGAVGSLLCFWLPPKSGARTLAMVACGLDTTAILLFLGMVVTALGGGLQALSPEAFLARGALATMIGILGLLLLAAGWVLHMLGLRALGLYVKDRRTAADAQRTMIVGLVVLIVPPLLLLAVNLALGRAGSLAGVIIFHVLLIGYYGGLLAVAFKVLNLTSAVRQLL
jgi:hypothetical protein